MGVIRWLCSIYSILNSTATPSYPGKTPLMADVSIDGLENMTYSKNLEKVFSYPHSNELTVKIIYYLDYLNIKRKMGPDNTF
ncbi:MAG: DUF5916 domain-containing protein [Ginsengibacter sp.]